MNGIVIWHEIIYNDDFAIKCGILDDKLKWSLQYKQGVYLLDKIIEKNEINYLIDIDLKNGIFNFKLNN